MSNHPINQLLRLLIELTAMVVYGAWGYHFSEGWHRYLLAIAIPAFFAAIWGVFAVPDDPSRSGRTVIPTPGKVRLMVELLLFSAAAGMISGLWKTWMAWVFGGVVLVHYLTSYDRLTWLLKQR